VVLDDVWAKGWSAQVDGRPVPILRVDDVMRGVEVPAGKHTVSWRYEVPGLRAGGALSAVALLIIVGGWGWIVVRRRKGGAFS
jgi:uncharacterized membrane protein YfhO